MHKNDLRTIDQSEVRGIYNGRTEIWSRDDKWHSNTHRILNKYLADFMKDRREGELILNAGSASPPVELQGRNVVNLDIAEQLLPFDSLSTCGSVEMLPFKSETFDSLVCIGSVINYCNLICSVGELCRVLKSGGHLLVEIETSTSLEYIFKDMWNSSIDIAYVNYNNSKEKIWLYSVKLVLDTLRFHGVSTYSVSSFNILSSFACALGVHEYTASKMSKFDAVAGKVPFLKTTGSNLVVFCKKV